MHPVTFVLAFLMLVYLGVNYKVFLPRIHPKGRRILTILVAVIIPLALAQLYFVLTWTQAGFWYWFLDSNQEFSLGTMFSTMLLALTSALGLVIAIWGVNDRHQRIFWLILCAAFVYLAIDESGFLQIHERLDAILWRAAYSLVGGIIVVYSFFLYWRQYREKRWLYSYFIVGLAIMGASGIFVEHIIQSFICFIPGWGPTCHFYYVIEETFETAGTAMVFTAVAVFAITMLPAIQWRKAKPILIVAGLLPWVWISASLWIVPTVELQLWGTPVHTEYVDGNLQLVGYKPSQTVAHPGESVTFSLYLKAQAPLDTNYNWSVRLLTQPNAETVTFNDVAYFQQYETSAWIPGIVAKKNVTVDIPEDAPAPASYWIVAGIWYDTREPQFIPYTSSEQQALNEYQVVLGSIAILPEVQPVAPQDLGYKFANGIELLDFSLPSSITIGESLPLEFWWHTESDIDGRYVQFIHLVDESGEAHPLDREPLGGKFPTSDWPASMTVQDQWETALDGEKFPPGTYQVFTGLYDAQTIERLPVTDANGQPITNHAIEVGTITIEGD